MRKKPAKPAIPPPAVETVRQSIIDLILGIPHSAKDISMHLRIPEKEVYGHLEHIRRSIHPSGCFLEVTPAECRSCGFLFAKRDRLSPPGKCPVCRKEAIFDPLFAIRRRDEDGES